MHKFAKLFETDIGQVLITKEYDDSPELAIHFALSNGVRATPKVAFEDTDEGEAKRNAAFDSLDAEKVMEEVVPIYESLNSQFGSQSQ